MTCARIWDSSETTCAPLGDENPNMQNASCLISETTYTPSGDENTDVVPDCFSVIGNNLHPVRGRKLLTRITWLRFHSETTYAPSGDENALKALNIVFFFRNNLHPVRGRKRYRTSSNTQHIFETTYTPPGDENPFKTIFFIVISFLRNNLHPVRGRKLLSSFPRAVFQKKQLTPRQGTKTLTLSYI